jgi:hypothetical protein
LLILKVIILQSFWFLAVKAGPNFQELILALSIILVMANFFIFKPKISLAHYIGLLITFVFFGLLEDSLLKYLGLVNYGQATIPLWLLSLYVIFLAYYGDIFEKFKELPLIIISLLGGLGGVSAFWSGAKISPMTVLSNYYFIWIFISWAIFFPISLIVFNKLSKRYIFNSGE